MWARLVGYFCRAGLASWHFNPNQNQLDLTTDEGVQPRVQLIGNPTRLVIDLPGIILGHPQTNQRVGSVIQEIRVGQFDPDTTRMVIALAPGYTLDPTKVRVRGESSTHWFVQLPTPERLADNYLHELLATRLRWVGVSTLLRP
jgi:beta-lactamase class A